MVINGIEWWLMVIFMVIFMVIDNHYRNHTKRYTYLYITYLSGWCFGTWLWLFHWLGIIILPDFHMFQRGRYTTNQNVMKYSITCIDIFSISDEEPFGCSLVTVMLKWRSRNMLEASIRLDYQLCGLSTRLPTSHPGVICQPLLVSLSRSDAVTPNAGLQAVQVEAFSSVIGFLEKLEEGLFRLGFCRFPVGEDFGGLWCDGFSMF